METSIAGIQNAGAETLENGRNFAQKTLETIKTKGKELTQDCEGVAPGTIGEGSITKRIERLTAQIPSATFLSLAVASVGLSATLRMMGRKEDAQFVGHWVPTILTLGLYNKLVKLEGSE